MGPFPQDDCVAMPKAQNLQFSGHGWRLRIKKAPGQRKEEATASSSETKTVLDDRPIESAPKTPESSSVASFIVPEMDSRFLHPRFALIVKLLTVLLVCYSVFLGKSYAAANYVLEDASASKVTSKHTRVPKNILAAVNGNRARAEAKWLRNIEWRRQNGADDILHQPHKYFHQIKKYYPHSIHLKDKDGLYTYWERPGHVDVKGLKKSGINSDILFWHYIWHTEYTWQVVAPKDGAKVTVVQDYGGFTPEKVSLEVLNFVKRAIAMTSEYYPERADKILIVNVPEWYNNIYNILKNFMSEKMRKRIHFFTAKDVQEGKLTRYIPASNLPEEYGGKSKIPLGESKEEKRMKHYVDKRRPEKRSGGSAVLCKLYDLVSRRPFRYVADLAFAQRHAALFCYWRFCAFERMHVGQTSRSCPHVGPCRIRLLPWATLTCASCDRSTEIHFQFVWLSTSPAANGPPPWPQSSPALRSAPKMDETVLVERSGALGNLLDAELQFLAHRRNGHVSVSNFQES
eukprot:scaffold1881_cov256-Pinguiococcus_pyrenoidosus.AAC.8